MLAQPTVRTRILAVLAIALCATSTRASVVLSPIAVLQNTAGFCCDANDNGNMIDRSGLINPFVSGVTDFDSYIGQNPMHTFGQVSHLSFLGSTFHKLQRCPATAACHAEIRFRRS